MSYISKINDKIYLSNWSGAANLDFLDELGIRKIISLGNKNEQDMYIFHEEFDEAQKFNMTHKFVYLKITIDDLPDENISQYFEDANKFISENDKVLIHCNKGISRSATIVISYLMKNGLSFDDSFNLVKKKRNIIKPNKGFIEQLQQFYLD